jgi:hypothetical protein
MPEKIASAVAVAFSACHPRRGSASAVLPEQQLHHEPAAHDGNASRNKSKKTGTFLAPEKHHPTHHVLPATHHKFTSKKPRSAHHLSQKPLQKPPSTTARKNHSRGSSILSNTCAM